jgi:type VI secretion system protein ImpC
MGENNSQEYLEDETRVSINYVVETNGAAERKELPQNILITDDFSGSTKKKLYKKREFCSISSRNFADIMKGMGITADVEFQYNNKLQKHSLKITKIDDFNPNAIVEQVDVLREGRNNKSALHDLRILLVNNEHSEKPVLAFLKGADAKKSFEGFTFNNEEEENYYLNILTKVKKIDLLKKDPAKGKTNGGAENFDLINLINLKRQEITEQIGLAMNEILHCPIFKQLEAAWLGVKKVLSEVPTGRNCKISIFNCSKDELFRDLDGSMDFKSSKFFKHVYDDCFGTTGGIPFSFCILGFTITRSPRDIQFLKKISAVCSAAHMPMVAGASAEFFGLKSYEDFYNIKDLSDVLDSPLMAPYRALRAIDDSRYLSLVAPGRCLGRAVYSSQNAAPDDLVFDEQIDDIHDNYLWISAAYEIGVLWGKSFIRHGWYSTTIGIRNGGKLNALPTHTFQSQDGQLRMKCPTEVAISDRRELQLSEAGFIAPCYYLGESFAVIYDSRVIIRPKIYDDPIASANSRESAKAHNVLNASRIAHYIRLMVREKLGDFASKDDVRSLINNWLTDLTVTGDDLSPRMKRRYPLEAAHVEVEDRKGRKGFYLLRIFVVPHSQLEGINATLSIVTEIPGGDN